MSWYGVARVTFKLLAFIHFYCAVGHVEVDVENEL